MCLLCLWCVSHVCFVFFFKQKTAYEMRISDWSADVCSSDLRRLQRIGGQEVVVLKKVPTHFRAEENNGGKDNKEAGHAHAVVHRVVGVARNAVQRMAVAVFGALLDFDAVGVRSEEHTSELQSLMRISYAVFSLKKTTNNLIYN